MALWLLQGQVALILGANYFYGPRATLRALRAHGRANYFCFYAPVWCFEKKTHLAQRRLFFKRLRLCIEMGLPGLKHALVKLMHFG